MDKLNDIVDQVVGDDAQARENFDQLEESLSDWFMVRYMLAAAGIKESGVEIPNYETDANKVRLAATVMAALDGILPGGGAYKDLLAIADAMDERDWDSVTE